jgi:hypothetical protein
MMVLRCFFLSIIGFLLTTYTAYIIDELFLLAVYLLYIVLGLILYRNKEERFFYFLSLCAYLLILPFITNSYVHQTGYPFIPGGDAQDYYETVHEMSGGYFGNYYGRYKLFLFIVWQYYKAINIFVHTTHPVYFCFLNMFMCANIAPVLYKIGSRYFNEKVVWYSCLLTCLYPLIIQVATGTWRDGFTYAPFLYSIYLAMNHKNIKQVVVFLLIVLFLMNIRMEIGIASLAFFLIYNYVFATNLNNRKKLNKVYLLFILLALIFSYQTGQLNYLNYAKASSIEYQINTYNEKSNEYSENNSLSNKLRNSGIAGRGALCIYTLFVPLPPPVFMANTNYFHYYFISLGAIMWYFIFPIATVEIINFKNEKLVQISKSYLTTFIIGIIIIALTAVGSFRHKLYLYPIMFLYFFNYILRQSRNTRIALFTKIMVVYLSCFVGYLLIKNIW